MTTKVSKGKQRLTRVQVVFLVILILAISAYVYMKYRKQKQLEEIDQMYEYAMQQCEKYGGEHGETPIQTEGVFDNRRPTAQHAIFERAAFFIGAGLKFVEFNGNLVRFTGSTFRWDGPYFKGARTKFNFYRVSVIERGDASCEPYEQHVSNRDWLAERYKLKDGECLFIEGFDDHALLSAPYELVVADRVVDEGVPVQWNNLEIIERASGTVVASFNTFSHCLTDTRIHASEGFSYCRGIYGNKKVRPQCPESYAEDANVVTDYERSAFTYTRNP